MCCCSPDSLHIVGARLCGDVPTICLSDGQRFERAVYPTPCCIKVAAIKRHQRARGFEGRVRLV